MAAQKKDTPAKLAKKNGTLPKSTSGNKPGSNNAPSFLAYFAYHANNGKHGLEARSSLYDQALSLERKLAGLETAQFRLEQKIALMSDGAIDRDMLEEKARELLNFANPDDLIILDQTR